MPVKQDVLVLYLSNSALDASVIAWARYNGTDTQGSAPMAGDTNEPPYTSGVDALRDGWRLIQASPLVAHVPGSEFTTAYLKYEFFFEKLVNTSTLKQTANHPEAQL